MSDFRKSRIMLTAVYKNGEVLAQDFAVPARATVLPIPGTDKFQELNLRIAVAPGMTEELIEGLCRGSVNLSIEQMLSPAERESII